MAINATENGLESGEWRHTSNPANQCTFSDYYTSKRVNSDLNLTLARYQIFYITFVRSLVTKQQPAINVIKRFFEINKRIEYMTTSYLQKWFIVCLKT